MPKLSVAGLVLASRGGRRYGGPVALVRHEGNLLVERAVSTVREAGCAPVVVVLGAGAAQVRGEARLGEVTLVDDPAWKTGRGAALRAGAAMLAVADVGISAYLTARAAGVVTVPCDDVSDDTELSPSDPPA